MSVPLAPDAPDDYVVKSGDTLWDISAVFLRDPWYWPEIWYVNPQIENPHLIYPGDVLSLVYVDGKPRITMERGGDRAAVAAGAHRAARRRDPAIPYDILMDLRRPSADPEQGRGQATRRTSSASVTGTWSARARTRCTARGLEGRAAADSRYHDPARRRPAARSGRQRRAGLHGVLRRHRAGDPRDAATASERDRWRTCRSSTRPRDPAGRPAVPGAEPISAPTSCRARRRTPSIDGQVIAVLDGVSSRASTRWSRSTAARSTGSSRATWWRFSSAAKKCATVTTGAHLAQPGSRLSKVQPADRAHALGHGVQGARPHELRADRASDIGGHRVGDYHQAPELRSSRYRAGAATPRAERPARHKLRQTASISESLPGATSR